MYMQVAPKKIIPTLSWYLSPIALYLSGSSGLHPEVAWCEQRSKNVDSFHHLFPEQHTTFPLLRT
ncbi:hypothetical protein SPARK1531C2_05013 [Klebsiella grimontii]|nr:hypothetical protein SPARK1531C2_05013 [Klebsiella grimontii]